jgi:hypothetical protein
LQHSWGHRYRGHEGGTQQGSTPETGHRFLFSYSEMEQLLGQYSPPAAARETN